MVLDMFPTMSFQPSLSRPVDTERVSFESWAFIVETKFGLTQVAQFHK